MKKPIKRLQKYEWHQMKETLILQKWYKNKNGHIKGFYKDKYGNIYTHWLNDDEIEELKKESE